MNAWPNQATGLISGCWPNLSESSLVRCAGIPGLRTPIYGAGCTRGPLSSPAELDSDKFFNSAETKPNQPAWLNHDFRSGIEETEFIITLFVEGRPKCAYVMYVYQCVFPNRYCAIDEQRWSYWSSWRKSATMLLLFSLIDWPGAFVNKLKYSQKNMDRRAIEKVRLKIRYT